MYNYRIYAVLFLVVCVALGVAPSAAAQSQPSGITVTGSAELKGAPDVAYVNLGVVTEDVEAAAAAQANAAKTNAVIDAIIKAGIPKADIETVNYSVSPIVNYQVDPAVTTGYRVSNQVRVRTRNLAGVGSLIDTAIVAGANGVQGVTFDIEDKSAIRRRAMVEAMREAQADARLIAETLGVKLGKVTSVSVSGPVIPRPYEMSMMKSEAAPTPIIPGQVEVSASVTVVFAIM